MAKVKKFIKTVKAEASSKKAGIRFNPNTYVEINADMTDFSKSIVSAEINGTTTEYSLDGGGGGGSGYTRTLVYENPNPQPGSSVSREVICENINQYDYLEINYILGVFSTDSAYKTIFRIDDIINGYLYISGADDEMNPCVRQIESDGDYIYASEFIIYVNSGQTTNVGNTIIDVYGIKMEG